MKSDVICMGIGRVTPGEQRSRFLAVGLSDNTVRVISLDPNVRESFKLLLFYFSSLLNKNFFIIKILIYNSFWCFEISYLMINLKF